MANRRNPRRKTAQLAFEALSIEGGLLSPEWLAKAAQLQAGSQAEADYRVPKGLNLRDEIGRYWRIAQSLWHEFAAGRASGGDARALAERFVQGLLGDAFGFTSLGPVAPVVITERSYPIGFSAIGGRVPVVVAPAGEGIEVSSTAFGDEGRRRTAFGLCQEYLNAADEAQWGLVSDGLTLRVLRDNASLTRPAWIEADLERIFTEERYPDFAALWLLVHETRFGREGQSVMECALEAWRTAGREVGTRALKLRDGVQAAIEELGKGFISHPDNRPLRDALQAGSLTTTAYFQQLLRMVYRFILLVTVEERGLLHPDSSPVTEAARRLYAEGYGIRRLRDRSVKRNAHDRFADVWEATKIVFRGVAAGEPRLALPALGGIFAANQCPALDTAKLQNHSLLLAVFRLSWLREDGGLARVNWRDMGPEELGSVYESLLELDPDPNVEKREFNLRAGNKGNARKTSGSYYTPDSLVQVLLDSALDPVIAGTIAKNPANPVEALLGLSIVDPACGSGHFLLAAARRLAAHVARLQANGTPSAAEYRHALRQVVGHCIYGVDLNPMAVELCKVSLWMEAVEPGLPLTFLDSHIQHGNALLGATPELMAKGVPDAAWEPIEGDDRKTASALKKRNKTERTTPNLSFEFSAVAEGASVALLSQIRALDAAPDLQAAEIERKEATWRNLLASAQFRGRRLAADAWCAAFVWPKQLGDLAGIAPTHDVWERLRHSPESVSPRLIEQVEKLAGEYSFFHWHLQFPQVFAKGGFDVVLGNPPWERVKLQEQEFFASRDEEIARAPNAAARKKLIAGLRDENPHLWAEWCAASRRAEGESHAIRQSGRYPMCGKGDVNTYAIFAEHNRDALAPQGRAGFIVPAGLVTDDTTKEFFADLIVRGRLAAVYHFENEERIFPTVHNAYRFVLLTLGQALRADLVFFARQVSALAEKERHVSLAPAEFVTLNPNTRTCPTFRSQRDADINLAMYRRVGILWRDADEESGNAWGLRFMGMFHMANDSGLFRTRAQLEPGQRYLPLFEAKMAWHFDHRFSTYEGATQANLNKGTLPQATDAQHADPLYGPTPEYWVAASDVASRLAGTWTQEWLLGWRDITGTEKQRTVVASVIPAVGVGHTTPLLFPDVGPRLVVCLYALLCSFAFDYAARQKVGGTHLTHSYLKQLPVPVPSTYATMSTWQQNTSLSDWLLPRVLELTYTAWDLAPFARDVGYDGPPFRWDPARRFLLRCELDAAFFHLYGISQDDVDYIIDTFPIVRKNDEKAHGEYRTKQMILKVYDAMAEATRTGKPFQTLLDPPAADPRVAHPPREVPVVSLPSGSWERPQQDQEAEAGAALAAILKSFGRATPIREVRLAGILVLEPRLLPASLSDEEAATWRRLIGGEAAPLQKGMVSFVPSADRAWGAALRQLRGSGLLVEDGAKKTWAPGPGIGAIQTDGWPDGRARMVVTALRSREVGQILKDLPDDARTWVDAAAA
jgi:hypothetical protein